MDDIGLHEITKGVSIAKEKSIIKIVYVKYVQLFMCEWEGEREGGRERQKNLGPKPISDERGLEEAEAAKETGEGTTNQVGGKLKVWCPGKQEEKKVFSRGR